MCESVDLIPLVESKALVLEMPIPEEMYPETVELVEFLANVPKGGSYRIYHQGVRPVSSGHDARQRLEDWPGW